VDSRFSFSGRLNFRPVPGFDLFSFGSSWADGQAKAGDGLFFSNLYITMSFDLGATGERRFGFDPGFITFDPKESVARPASLYSNFPLSITGLISGRDDKAPADLGFLPINVPDAQLLGLSGPWYALQFQLNLGTLGALAGEAGLVAAPLFAWSPGSGGSVPEACNAAVGIKLPGAGGGQARLFSLQGILKLSISDIEWLFGETQEGTRAYLLKFSRIALQFFGIKFPPGGNTVFFLFGDPAPGAPQSNLGWYAAYAKKSSAGALAIATDDSLSQSKRDNIGTQRSNHGGHGGHGEQAQG
jgi:hypothetical protein